MFRFALLIAAAAQLAATATSVQAQPFPSRPITLIIPWQAGGVPDTQYRVLADIASKQLGQPITVENKPGGVGTLGPSSMSAPGCFARRSC
jgi:tripartite-type tricarboxylate transporter receptor subunit TctC